MTAKVERVVLNALASKRGWGRLALKSLAITRRRLRSSRSTKAHICAIVAANSVEIRRAFRQVT
jgi:hypothetical protein